MDMKTLEVALEEVLKECRDPEQATRTNGLMKRMTNAMIEQALPGRRSPSATRSTGRTEPVCVTIGIMVEGAKNLPEGWNCAPKGAKLRLQALAEFRNRVVKEVLIAYMDASASRTHLEDLADGAGAVVYHASGAQQSAPREPERAQAGGGRRSTVVRVARHTSNARLRPPGPDNRGIDEGRRSRCPRAIGSTLDAGTQRFP